MKKTLRWLPGLILLSEIAGCGLKGPLYMPLAPDNFAAETVPSGTETSTNRPSYLRVRYEYAVF